MSAISLTLGILTLFGFFVVRSIIVPFNLILFGFALLGIILALIDKKAKGLRTAAIIVCMLSLVLNGLVGTMYIMNLLR